MDRCFALPTYGKKPFAGKRIAIAMNYGDTYPFTSGCVNALRCFQDAFKYVGARLIGTVYGRAEAPGEIGEQEALLIEAEKLGRKLIYPRFFATINSICRNPAWLLKKLRQAIFVSEILSALGTPPNSSCSQISRRR